MLTSYYQALQTNRTNLSPFTKDFRVRRALIELVLIFLRVFFRENLLYVDYAVYGANCIIKANFKGCSRLKDCSVVKLELQVC
jgi:hypothetical protein